MTDLDRQILDLEAQHFRHAGTKEVVVRGLFGWSMTRYTQRLNRLLDDPDAMAYSPLVVKRLRRVRDAGTSRAT